MPAAERLGGVAEARELPNPAYRLPVVTSTFHGRDMFAPAAAHLARGAAFESLGPAIDPAPLVAVAAARRAGRPTAAIETEVVYVDTFGNVKLSALVADVRDALGEPGRPQFAMTVDGGRTMDIPWARTFGDLEAGEPLLYEDSYGRACVGVNQGSRPRRSASRDGNRLELRPR